jgi:hypothetical protein
MIPIGLGRKLGVHLEYLGRGHALSGVLFEESAMIACIIEYDGQARDGRQAGKSLRGVGLRDSGDRWLHLHGRLSWPDAAPAERILDSCLLT